MAEPVLGTAGHILLTKAGHMNSLESMRRGRPLLLWEAQHMATGMEVFPERRGREIIGPNHTLYHKH